jgi:hypothetical protein
VESLLDVRHSGGCGVRFPARVASAPCFGSLRTCEDLSGMGESGDARDVDVGQVVVHRPAHPLDLENRATTDTNN